MPPPPPVLRPEQAVAEGRGKTAFPPCAVSPGQFQKLGLLQLFRHGGEKVQIQFLLRQPGQTHQFPAQPGQIRPAQFCLPLQCLQAFKRLQGCSSRAPARSLLAGRP